MMTVTIPASDEVETMAQRLLKIRQAIPQLAFARRMGVHKNTLARYEAGERMPDTDFMLRLAEAGINLHWFVTGKGPRFAALAELSRSALIFDPLSGLAQYARGEPAAGCRIGDEAGSYHLSAGAAPMLSDAWLQQYLGVSIEDVCLLPVQGDCMEPVLKNGDMVLVDGGAAEAPLNDGIFALALGDSCLIRRLQRLPGRQCRVLSANPEYPGFQLRLDENGCLPKHGDCQMLGRVIWAGQRLF